ncbi:MAG TPA: ADOP family duplicated permease [Thermoanaerobaculia bacterium]
MFLSLLHDFRVALRRLGRDWKFAAAAVATLALGIGGNTAIFTIVERFLVRSLPFPDADRLVRINDTTLAPGGQYYRPQVLPWHWNGVATQAHSFDRVVAISPERLTWIGGEAAVAYQGANVSAGTFELLGVRARHGRLFNAEETRLGERANVAVVSDRFWKTRLGGREDAMGAPLRLADKTATIVGVLPPDYRFPYSCDIWQPLTIEPSDPRDLFTVARLAPGVTLEAANKELADIAKRQEATGPTTIRDRGMDARFLKDAMVQEEQRIPVALMAAVGFLLLLACVNLASLLLVRSVARQRERAIRAALGASRSRQVRETLAETLILSVAGGGLGLLLASRAAEPLAVLVPRVFGEDLPLVGSAIGPTVTLFACILSVATGLVFGLVPAWRGAHADPSPLLAGAGRSVSLSSGVRRLLSGFVVAEIALATLLLAGGALMLADFWERQQRSLGLQAANLFSVEVPLRDASEGSGDRRRQLVRESIRSVSAIPGVASCAVTTGNPFSQRRWGVRIAPAENVDPGRELSTVNLRLVSPGLLRTYGTAIVAGRECDESDRPDSPPVVVVSHGLARRFWGEESPLGKRMVRRAPDGSLIGMTIVGVAGDIREVGDIQESVYIPYEQMAASEAAEAIYVMVRGQGSGGWAREVPRVLARVDPRMGIAEMGFMEALYEANLKQNRAGTSILAFFAGFGLLLSSMGILATVSFVALQRRSELGIRAALGATPSQIRRLILGQGFALAVAGCSVGLLGALAANRALSAAIGEFRVRPGLCAAVAAALLLVTAAASDMPARQAARRDPLKALRE